MHYFILNRYIIAASFFKLLLKFYNLKEGCIKIFGKVINTFSLEELRSLIAYVPQDNYLFSGTIADNISYGKDNATFEQVTEAAKSANAHDFIMALPEVSLFSLFQLFIH